MYHVCKPPSGICIACVVSAPTQVYKFNRKGSRTCYQIGRWNERFGLCCKNEKTGSSNASAMTGTWRYDSSLEAFQFIRQIDYITKIITCHRPNRMHGYQITWNRPRDGSTGVQANSFYFRIAKTWNNLPKNVVEARTIDTFKSRLDDAWKNHPTKRTINVPRATNDQDRFEETV